jgi:hypothetical protein
MTRHLETRRWVLEHLDQEEGHTVRLRAGSSRRAARVQCRTRDVDLFQTSLGSAIDEGLGCWADLMVSGQSNPVASRHVAPMAQPERPAADSVVAELLASNTALVDRVCHLAERVVATERERMTEIRDLSLAAVLAEQESPMTEALKLAMPALLPALQAVMASRAANTASNHASVPSARPVVDAHPVLGAGTAPGPLPGPE